MKRKCNKCKRELRLEDFHRDSSKSGGRGYTCKECKRTASRKWHEDNTEKKREYQRIYYHKNRLDIKLKEKEYNENLRLYILEKLDPQMKCSRCGTIDKRVLSIIPIHNTGYKNIKKILYMDTSEARERYRILCKNCSWIVHLNRKV